MQKWLCQIAVSCLFTGGRQVAQEHDTAEGTPSWILFTQGHIIIKYTMYLQMNYVETEEIKPWLAKRKELKVK
jgi:hypothetical protein